MAYVNPVIPYKGKLPTIGAGAFIASNAVVIGDTVLGDRASVWFNCVVRGDGNYIRIGADTNIQDGTIIHINTGTHPCIIGQRVTVGHGAIIHACTVEDDCMIGIAAVVLDGAVVERHAIVAAGAVVPPGKRVKSGEMWSGCPAKFQRTVRPEEIEFIAHNAREYHHLAMDYMKG